MSQRRTLLASLFLCTGLLTAGSSAADEVKVASFDYGWNTLQAGLEMRAAVPALRAQPDSTRVQPVSARANAPGFGGVKLWASGAAYAVGRRSAGYGLQGGASLALNEAVDLTASYRVNGFALGDRLDPELADVQERTGAPFLGLDIAF